MTQIEFSMKEVGRRIFDRRHELSMTQEELAEKSGLTTQFISYAETEKRAMRSENLLKLSAALKVSAEYLLTEIVDKLNILYEDNTNK